MRWVLLHIVIFQVASVWAQEITPSTSLDLPGWYGSCTMQFLVESDKPLPSVHKIGDVAEGVKVGARNSREFSIFRKFKYFPNMVLDFMLPLSSSGASKFRNQVQAFEFGPFSTQEVCDRIVKWSCSRLITIIGMAFDLPIQQNSAPIRVPCYYRTGGMQSEVLQRSQVDVARRPIYSMPNEEGEILEDPEALQIYLLSSGAASAAWQSLKSNGVARWLERQLPKIRGIAGAIGARFVTPMIMFGIPELQKAEGPHARCEPKEGQENVFACAIPTTGSDSEEVVDIHLLSVSR